MDWAEASTVWAVPAASVTPFRRFLAFLSFAFAPASAFVAFAIVSRSPADWAAKFDVPAEKLGRLLIVEDALRAAFDG